MWDVTRNIRNLLSLTRHLSTMMTEHSFAEFAEVQVHLVLSPPSLFCVRIEPSQTGFECLCWPQTDYSQFFRWTLESNSVME